MKNHLSKRSLFCVGLWLFLCGSASAGIIINGDFETGDFTGWTVSAIDELGNPISPNPFLSVVNLGGNHVARFKTGTLAAGLFLATLEQSYTVEAGKPLLTFDFSLPVVTPDPASPGSSSFLDSLLISVADATTSYELLLLDANGALADPFGTAPGTVALGASLVPGADHVFQADLSSLAGADITLYFDMTNEDDGFQFDPDFFDVYTDYTWKLTPVPEPATLLVWAGLGLACAVGRLGRRRRRGRADRGTRFRELDT